MPVEAKPLFRPDAIRPHLLSFSWPANLGDIKATLVTNKWMKAGYGEPLRRFFSSSVWMESVIDFGHAKQIFEDADVFPSIIVLRKPTVEPRPAKIRVCAIPRETLRLDDLSQQISDEGFDISIDRLNADAWQLEPSGVNTLISKIRGTGVPLSEFLGVKPIYGIKTGFNEAFLIDTPTRNRLLASDPKSDELIKPYLRGQDVDRWRSDWAELWMIFSRKGTNIDAFPAIKSHLEQFRTQLEPKPRDWTGPWPGRATGNHEWFELQTPVENWNEFAKPKIVYQEIQFHPRYAFDTKGFLANNKVFFIPTNDLYLLAVLNSPLMWWHNWRYLPHMKDEALSPAGFLMETLPIAEPSAKLRNEVESRARRLIEITDSQQTTKRALLDWLRVEYEIDKPSQKLQNAIALDSDGLVDEVKKIRGKSRPLTSASLKALRDEDGRTLTPARVLAIECESLERQLSDLINAAYGITPEEAALIWKTAPPRMPIKSDTVKNQKTGGADE